MSWSVSGLEEDGVVCVGGECNKALQVCRSSVD